MIPDVMGITQLYNPLVPETQHKLFLNQIKLHLSQGGRDLQAQLCLGMPPPPLFRILREPLGICN